MTQKEQLQELHKRAFEQLLEEGKEFSHENYAAKLVEGGAIVIPCKPGDTVYRIKKRRGTWCILPRYVTSVTYRLDHLYRAVFEIFSTETDILGNTVFLSREEAEKALERRAK